MSLKSHANTKMWTETANVRRILKNCYSVHVIASFIINSFEPQRVRRRFKNFESTKSLETNEVFEAEAFLAAADND